MEPELEFSENSLNKKTVQSRPGLSSFLDQVKSAVNSEGSGGQMSFLKQIQQARRQKEESEEACGDKENAGHTSNIGTAVFNYSF